MLVIPQGISRDLCDGVTRRELLRVGGSAVFGLSLSTLLQSQAKASEEEERYGGPGYGKAKSVILLYLQGGRATSICGTRKRTSRTTSEASSSRSTR